MENENLLWKRKGRGGHGGGGSSSGGEGLDWSAPITWAVIISSIGILLFCVFTCICIQKYCCSSKKTEQQEPTEQPHELEQLDTTNNQQARLAPCLDGNGKHLTFQGFYIYEGEDLEEYYFWNNSQYVPIRFTRDQYGNGHWQQYQQR